jgi:hypothetical protein
MEWDLTGVGVHRDASGRVFATQLFAKSAPVVLDPVEFTTREKAWLEFHFRIRVGAQYEAAAFVRNEFSVSAEPDRRGVAALTVKIPPEPGQYHVGIGRRLRGDDHGWIGVYDGMLTVEASAPPSWESQPPAYADVHVEAEDLFRVNGTSLHVGISGTAREPAMVLSDSSVQQQLVAGERFSIALEFDGRSGMHVVDVGLPGDGNTYQVCHRFEVDTDAGSLREAR